MLSDKELKKAYRPVFWGDPDKYFPTEVLRARGMHRGICKKCEMPFWNLDKAREVCGDPNCVPGESFGFIGKTPAKNPLTYVEVWKKFSSMFEGFGYTPIKRYPVVARWNPTMEYTNASIAAFQPFVISGEVSPPANPLTIPQFSMRFSDIDNVGITQSHCTGFIMIGQHMFVSPEEWDQNKAFECMLKWLEEGVGVPLEELTFHEDAWAGGGNLGCCVEMFSRGCEIANQVYMLYEQTSEGVQELNLKVLDMGMGMERNAWFSQGRATIYDCAFPFVVDKLRDITKTELDEALMMKFVPHAGRLNVDEVEDMGKAWLEVAELVGEPVDVLKAQILPNAAVYSIAEHARTLLFALSDGALPSNVGGGYNLRILIRRSLGFIDKYKWNVYLPDVCRWHAEELQELFPELSESLDNVQKILDVEKRKYESTKQKTAALVERLAKMDITTEQLFELYDSHGIAPELITEEAVKHGINVDVPDDFYMQIAERHSSVVVQKAKAIEKFDLDDVDHTEALYYDDWEKVSFEAKVLKVIKDKVVLDKTYVYPTSGGQAHDVGYMHDAAGQRMEFVDAFKQGPHILHILKGDSPFKEGDTVTVHIDFDRRLQLAQHHTGTHVLGAASRKVLGPHINQAGAKKTIDKAHLDITHYDSLSDGEVMKIEEEANRIIALKNPIHKAFYPRDEAEKNFGTAIYQGGAVPGNNIRIVHVVGIDVQACGGTHLDNTEQIGKIKILKSSKIQDGVVRLTFVAGAAAEQAEATEGNLLGEVAELLDCDPSHVPGRCEELFTKWKKVKKAKKKQAEIPSELLKLTSKVEYEGDALAKAAEVLKTQPEHVAKTVKRFLSELE
ncbi:MAG: alanine--tRNA ligase [Candidatus Nanoarchaeia archaeon]